MFSYKKIPLYRRRKFPYTAKLLYNYLLMYIMPIIFRLLPTTVLRGITTRWSAIDIKYVFSKLLEYTGNDFYRNYFWQRETYIEEKSMRLSYLTRMQAHCYKNITMGKRYIQLNHSSKKISSMPNCHKKVLNSAKNYYITFEPVIISYRNEYGQRRNIFELIRRTSSVDYFKRNCKTIVLK